MKDVDVRDKVEAGTRSSPPDMESGLTFMSDGMQTTHSKTTALRACK